MKNNETQEDTLEFARQAHLQIEGLLFQMRNIQYIVERGQQHPKSKEILAEVFQFCSSFNLGNVPTFAKVAVELFIGSYQVFMHENVVKADLVRLGIFALTSIDSDFKKRIVSWEASKK